MADRINHNLSKLNINVPMECESYHSSSDDSSAGMDANNGETDMEAQIHQLGQEAYFSVLRAFKAQAKGISWETEILITELMTELRVSVEEHRELLCRVISDDFDRNIRLWRQCRPGMINTGMLSIGQPKPEPAKGASFDQLIGRKVRIRCPDDNYLSDVAIISGYNLIVGEHSLCYDMGTPYETWEWLNLSKIPPEDIQWIDGPRTHGINLAAGRKADKTLPRSNQNGVPIPRGGCIAIDGRSAVMSSAPYSSMFGETNMEAEIHQFEQEAYMSVLRAFKAQVDSITLENTRLIAELRKMLRLSMQEHREVFRRLDSDEVIQRIREWRRSRAHQPAGIPNTCPLPDMSPTCQAAANNPGTTTPLVERVDSPTESWELVDVSEV